MPRTSRTSPPYRTALPVLLATGAVAVGVVVAGLALAGAATPLAAAPALLAGTALAACGLALAWVRRRVTPPPAAGRMTPEADLAARLALVPLGDGQAAVVYDEPPVAGPAHPRTAADRGEATATAAAIWRAIDEAVALEAARGRPGAAATEPSTAPRPGAGWLPRLAARIRRLAGGKSR